MPQNYDSTKHAEMTAAQEVLYTDIQTLAEKMHDDYNSDEWEGEKGPAKMIRYNADQQRHGQLTREVQLISQQIERMEDIKPIDVKAVQGTIQDSLRRWMRSGAGGLEQDERDILLSEPTPEMSAMSPTSDMGEVFDPFGMLRDNPAYAAMDNPYSRVRYAAGDPSRGDITAESATGARDALGEAAPETWAAGLVERLKFYGAVADSCHNFTTSNGNTIHQNQLDTTDQEGEGLYDQSQTAAQGVPTSAQTNLGNVTDIEWKAFWRHSNFIGARIETFDDIHFDVSGRITREMTRRMGRGWNNWFTKGTNANQPQGLVPSATVIDGGAGSADDGSGGVDYQNLLDMEYGVDLAYTAGDEGGDGGFRDLHGGMICFQMNRNIEKGLRNVLHGTSNLPIWVPNLERGIAIQKSPGMILGYPYKINQHMDDGKTVDSLPLLFGAFGHFGVRNVGGPMFYRFWDSRTVRRMEVEFIGFSRRDSRTRGPVVSGKCEAYVALQVKA